MKSTQTAYMLEGLHYDYTVESYTLRVYDSKQLAEQVQARLEAATADRKAYDAFHVCEVVIRRTEYTPLEVELMAEVAALHARIAGMIAGIDAWKAYDGINGKKPIDGAVSTVA